MTGGIGFSRQGQESFKQNRELLSKRPMLKDRLSMAPKEEAQSKRTSPAYTQLLDWKKRKDSNAQKLSLQIWIALAAIVLFSLIMPI